MEPKILLNEACEEENLIIDDMHKEMSYNPH